MPEMTNHPGGRGTGYDRAEWPKPAAPLPGAPGANRDSRQLGTIALALAVGGWVFVLMASTWGIGPGVGWSALALAACSFIASLSCALISLATEGRSNREKVCGVLALLLVIVPVGLVLWLLIGLSSVH